MLDLEIVRSFIYENFENVSVQNNGTHFHARCPLCGDSKISRTKKRFHLDYKNGNPVFNCFNCNESGGFLKIYCRVLGISQETAIKRLYRYDSDRLKRQLVPKKSTVQKPNAQQPNFNWILNDCASEELEVESIQYETWIKHLRLFRENREIPESIKLFYAYKGNYKGRIIIPIYDGENIIYFQGRRMPDTNIEPKYKNPVAEKSLIIHNREKFDRDKYIIVTEGLIDCAMIGDQGTTMLGVEAADEFLKTLMKLTDVGVILAYDNDAPGMKALKKFMANNKYRKMIKYFLMPTGYKECKDINILRTEHKIGDLYDFVVTNSNTYVTTVFILGGYVNANNQFWK